MIIQSKTITIESNDVIHVNKEAMGIKASTFLYNLQQRTIKIDIEKYSKNLMALNISPHPVANTPAKQTLESSSESGQVFPQVENNSVGKSCTLVENNPVAQNQHKNDLKKKRTKQQTKKRPFRRCGLSFPGVKKLNQFYLKATASYGNIKRLQTQSKLPLGQVQSYLEAKPSFTKHRSIRLKFTRLKVFVKDINKNWSLNLAHVDKLAK